MNKVIVTTSWDDGHVLDMRLAALLKKYDVKGTFYISPRDHEISELNRLSDQEIKELSKDFEIGAHTMTHPRLNSVTDSTAQHEILESKKYLEKLTGKEVSTFCYPGGFYEKRTVRTVRELGFKYARTVKRFSFSVKDGQFLEARTSVNTYNHYSDLWKVARFTKFKPIRTYQYFHWDVLAKAMFDKVMEEGGEYHLWGHSWEVDGHRDWEKLEDVLRYISGRQDVSYVTNGELTDLKNKKLLIVAPYYPPHPGGQEFYAYNVAKRLQSGFGWDVIVATSGNKGFRPSRTVQDGLCVYRLPYWFKLFNTPMNPMWIIHLRKIVKIENVDIINAHEPVPGMAEFAALIAGRVPFLITYHALSMKKGKACFDRIASLFEGLVLPWTLGRASRVVCTSSAIRDELPKEYASKSDIITPGVDIDFYTPASTYKRNVVLYVGSVNKTDAHKGLKYLLEAFADVSREHPSARLKVVGSGKNVDYFKDLATRLKISEKVTFTGGLFNDDLKEAFCEASMLVVPSLSESFGMACVEAMACGLPVVVTRVGVMPKIVGDGQNGFIVPPGNVSALADKIAYLLDNPTTAKKFGASSRAKAKGLSWDSSVKKTNDILLSALPTLEGETS